MVGIEEVIGEFSHVISKGKAPTQMCDVCFVKLAGTGTDAETSGLLAFYEF